MIGSGRKLVVVTFFALLVAFAATVAQEQETYIAGPKENHFERLPDGTYRTTSSSGTGLNRDYYLDPNTGPPGEKSLLYKVEQHHLGQKEWDQIAAGNYASASNDVKYTLRRFPNHPAALQMMGIIAKATGQNDMAVKYFDHALAIYPQYGFTYALYGKYLIDVGAYDAGIRKLNAALEVDARLGRAHGWIAEAYAKNGQMDLALEAAKRAREVGYRGRISGVREK